MTTCLEPVPNEVAEDVLMSRRPDAVGIGRLITRHGIEEKLRYGGDAGIINVGLNGKGKGACLLIPHLLQSSESSIVVVDPKGELAAVTAPYRRTLGRVVIINPYGILTDVYEDLKSDGFNPLARLDPSLPSFNSKVSQLAEALITIDVKDPHWSTSARALVAAIIMHAVIEARKKGEVATMTEVRRLLCQMSDEPCVANDGMGLGIPRMALEMMRSDNAGLRNKAAQFTNWNKEIQSIVSSARTQTESFDDVGIATDLEKNGIDFEDLKREPVTVYLILPPDMMERNAKWLRLLLTSAIHGVLRVRRKGKPRVLFMLDEFYALGHLEIIATVWALVRGYGIRLMPMLQDLGQLKTLYPKMWESFIGNAGVTTTFCTNDPTTAEWFSKRAGETTRDIESSSTTYSSGSSKVEGAYGPNAPGPNQITRTSGTSTVTSSAPQKTTLITAHKLNGLPPFYMMGFFNGMAHAVPIYAPPYFDIADCRRKARDNPYYLNED